MGRKKGSEATGHGLELRYRLYLLLFMLANLEQNTYSRQFSTFGANFFSRYL